MSEHTNPTDAQPTQTAPTSNVDTNFDFAPEDFADLDGMSEREPAGPQSPAPTSKIKIKYMGAEEEYDLATQQDDVVNLMQKGRNYDKILSEKEALEKSDELTFLREQATEAGFKDSKEYMAKLKADIQQTKVSERAKQLEAEGMNPQHALYTAQLEQKVQTETPRSADPDQAYKQELNNKFKSLIEEYPETKQFKTLSDFPKPVLEMIQQGKDPVVAYQKFLLDTERAKNTITQQNQDNAERDLGSLQSNQTNTKEDDFIAGLFGR